MPPPQGIQSYSHSKKPVPDWVNSDFKTDGPDPDQKLLNHQLLALLAKDWHDEQIRSFAGHFKFFRLNVRDPIYKFVPADGVLNDFSPYWLPEEMFQYFLQHPALIPEKLALPVPSWSAVYDVYVAYAKQDFDIEVAIAEPASLKDLIQDFDQNQGPVVSKGNIARGRHQYKDTVEDFVVEGGAVQLVVDRQKFSKPELYKEPQVFPFPETMFGEAYRTAGMKDQEAEYFLQGPAAIFQLLNGRSKKLSLRSPFGGNECIDKSILNNPVPDIQKHFNALSGIVGQMQDVTHPLHQAVKCITKYSDSNSDMTPVLMRECIRDLALNSGATIGAYMSQTIADIKLFNSDMFFLFAEGYHAIVNDNIQLDIEDQYISQLMCFLDQYHRVITAAVFIQTVLESANLYSFTPFILNEETGMPNSFNSPTVMPAPLIYMDKLLEPYLLKQGGLAQILQQFAEYVGQINIPSYGNRNHKLASFGAPIFGKMMNLNFGKNLEVGKLVRDVEVKVQEENNKIKAIQQSKVSYHDIPSEQAKFKEQTLSFVSPDHDKRFIQVALEVIDLGKYYKGNIQEVMADLLNFIYEKKQQIPFVFWDEHTKRLNSIAKIGVAMNVPRAQWLLDETYRIFDHAKKTKKKMKLGMTYWVMQTKDFNRYYFDPWEYGDHNARLELAQLEYNHSEVSRQ